MLRGTAHNITPETGNRVVCMCDDCQAYARYLGGAQSVLDEHGGTDIFQATPSQIVLAEGTEHLRCLRLSSKGLLRWYAGCCRTPVVNTVASFRVPFVGIVHSFMDFEGSCTRREALGPVIAYTQARYAVGEPPVGAHPRAPFGLIVRSLRLLARAVLKGAHKPSPFFTLGTGEPVVEPMVLSGPEREKLRASGRVAG